MKPKITRIRLEFEDGTFFTIEEHQIKQLELAYDTINFLERAKRLYENLRPLFKEVKK